MTDKQPDPPEPLEQTVREDPPQLDLTVRVKLRGPAPAEPLDESGPEQALQQLGRYPVTGDLGAGGMGQVLQVRDDHLGREMAAKVIRVAHGGQVGQQQLEKFVLEAQLTGQLEHPNIIPVHELGQDAAGRLYFTMKRVQGQDLQDLLVALADEAGQPSSTLPQLLQIFLKICDAISFAHSRGVIHRDLKPANIMVGQFGEVQVMDWGLAKVIASDTEKPLTRSPAFRVSSSELPVVAGGDSEPMMTAEGTIAGTPAYMPPEQAEGQIARLDQRSDIYSLGAILYQILTLRPPFLGSSGAMIINQVIEGKLVPPSKGTHGRRVPWELEAVVLKAMALRQTDRYETALQLRGDVERYLTGETLQAARYRFWQVAGKWFLRHLAASLAVMVVGAVLISLALTWYVTPGTLRLRVEPLGARISIAGKQWIADEKPITIDLPAGVYPVRVQAADHELIFREVFIERGMSKDLILSLTHHKARLEAHSFPLGSEIEVDGLAYGSRVRNLELNTGRHQLLAWAPEHFERELQVDLVEGQLAREYLWLDKGVIWTYSAPSIQGYVSLLPDLDADGSPDLAYQELLQLVFRSSRDGKELWRQRVAGNSRWRMVPANLGAEIGPVLFIIAEETIGLTVSCIDTASRRVRWSWRGPARSWKRPAIAPYQLVGDLSGDGVGELAVAGRDGLLFLIDGKTGKLWGEPRKIPLRPIYQTTGEEGMGLIQLDGQPHLLLIGHRTTGIDVRQRIAPGAACCLRLRDGKLIWTRQLKTIYRGLCQDLDGDGQPELIWNGRTHWGVQDARTGELRWQGKMPLPKLAGGFTHFQDLDGDGLLDSVLFYSGHAFAMRFTDGKLLWRIDDPALIHTATRPSGELLVWTSQGFGAVDPSSGRRLWTIKAHREEETVFRGKVLQGDWDGDGKQELLVGLPGKGLVCLDAKTGGHRWTLRIDGDFNPATLLPDIDGDGLNEIVIVRRASQLGVVRGPRTLWRRKSLSPLQATPLITGTPGKHQVIQLGKWPGGAALACLDGRSGATRWRYGANMAPNRAPALADWDKDGIQDIVFLGRPLKKWSVHAIRSDTAAELFSAVVPAGSEDYATPVVADLNGDGQPDFAMHRWWPQDVLAIDGKSGKPLWRHKTQGPNMGGVAAADLDGDRLPDVVAPSMDGYVYAVRGTDGKRLWRTKIDPGGSRSPPTLSDLTGDGIPEVLLVSKQGRLWVLEGKTGKPLWTSRPGSEGLGRPAVVRPPGSGPLILAPMGIAGVVAFDWTRRKVLWNGPKGKYVQASPVVADLDGDGRLELIIAAMAVKNRRLLDAELIVLDLRSGKRLWGVPLGQKMIEADPAIADLDGDGVLDILIATQSGELHAISGRATRGARRRLQRRR